MKYEEILSSDKDFLIPKDVAEVLGCDQYKINVQAKEDPGKLGFPVCMIGTRVRIPRMGFIRWMQYGNAPVMLSEESAAAGG
jgi:hypothetical protein